jgi:uncharacterized protein YidB (DUF937 family)
MGSGAPWRAREKEDDMGLLDELGKAIGGAVKGSGSAPAAGGGQGALTQAVIGMLAGGGLDGLVRSFQQKGLGDLIGSWVSTGKNLPVSADQIAKALGPDQLGRLAQQSGLDVGSVAGQLSSILPGLVDKLTPSGTLPDQAALEKGLGMLKGLL